MKLTAKGREEVQELTWRLIDDEIDDKQFNRLESVLRESDEGRKTYVDCMWLHSELIFFFRNERGETTAIKFVNDPLTAELSSPKPVGSDEPLPGPKPKRKGKGLLSFLFMW